MTFRPISEGAAHSIRRVIGRRIAAVMEARGVEREDMAKALGISDLKLARILKGSSEITGVELVTVAERLNAPLDYLTGRA